MDLRKFPDEFCCFWSPSKLGCPSQTVSGAQGVRLVAYSQTMWYSFITLITSVFTKEFEYLQVGPALSSSPAYLLLIPLGPFTALHCLPPIYWDWVVSSTFKAVVYTCLTTTICFERLLDELVIPSLLSPVRLERPVYNHKVNGPLEECPCMDRSENSSCYALPLL